MSAVSGPPRRSSLGILFLIVFTDLLGFGIVIPLLPRYGETLGASPAQLGALLASYSLLQFLFSPVWGRLSDRFGRKPILVLSLVGSVAGYTLFAAARTIPLLIFARALAGMMAANVSTAQAYIADVTPPEKRAKGMGLVGAAFGLGFSLGPFAGGALAALQGSSAFAPAHHWPIVGGVFSNPQGLPGLFAAFLSMTALLLAIVLLPESLTGKAPARPRTSRLRLIWEAVNRPNVGTVYILYFIYTLGFTQMEVTLAQLIGHRFGLDISHSYWLFAWVGFLGAIVQGALIGPLTRRFGESVLAAAGIFIVTISLGAMSFVPGIRWLMACLALLAVGAGLSTPSLSSLVSRLTPPTEQGSALGIFQSISSIARIVGPVVAQLLYQEGAHVHAPYLLATAAGALGFGLSLSLLTRGEGASAGPAANRAASPTESGTSGS